MIHDTKKNQPETGNVTASANPDRDIPNSNDSSVRDRVRDALLHPDILGKINSSHTENKSVSFESRLSEQLNSPEFLETLKQFPDIHRHKIIGLSIEYFIIHRDGFGFERYLQNLLAQISLLGISSDSAFMKVRTGLIIDSVAQKLGISNSGSEDEGKIVEYITTNFINEGYYFHGFNGAVETHIKDKGLDPHERLWDWEDLSEIQKIGTRVGEPTILGWSEINSKGKVFISDNLDNVYAYGIASPEWFAQFISGGMHIPRTPPYDKQAYYRRDYDAARTNIVTMCDKMINRSDEAIRLGKSHPKMTVDEKNKLLDFFEKYWPKFCNEQSLPKVALIRRKAIQRDSEMSFEHYNEMVERNQVYGLTQSTNILAEYIQLILTSSANDMGVGEVIAPQDIQIVTLPKYSEVH